MPNDVDYVGNSTLRFELYRFQPFPKWNEKLLATTFRSINCETIETVLFIISNMSPRDFHPVDLIPSESSCSSLTSLAEAQHKKCVSFGTVSVREYIRIVGEHPETKVGPPIALGHEFVENPTIHIDDFENSKPESKRSLRLSSITRKNLLLNVWGYSEEEVRLAEKEVQKIRKQRDLSQQKGKVGDVVDSAVTSTKRKFRRIFSGKNFVRGLSMAANGVTSFAIHA